MTDPPGHDPECAGPLLAGDPTEYLRLVGKMIAEHGVMVQAVGGAELPGTYAYTIGMTAHGLPEMVVSIPSLSVAHDMLMGAFRLALDSVDLVKAGNTLTGQQVGMSVPLRVITAAETPIGVAHMFYGDRLTLEPIQLLWPNAAGAFPGDPGWTDADAANQTVYA